MVTIKLQDQQIVSSLVLDGIRNLSKIDRELKKWGASQGARTSVISNMTGSGHYEIKLVRGQKELHLIPMGRTPTGREPGYYTYKSVSEHLGAAVKRAVRRKNGNAS